MPDLGFSRMIRRLVGARGRDASPDPPRARPAVEPRADEDATKQERQARASAWVKAFEAGLLNPPANVRDAEGWDTYWRNQMQYGMGELGLADLMASDESLPPFLEARRARTILCAGNGLSYESVALAILGFEVTALDISPFVTEVIEGTLREPEHMLRKIVGFTPREDGVWALETALDPAVGAPVHKSASFPPRAGGSLALATGDLMDPEVCKGPFDVVIERRTVQLFRDQREAALECLIRRLATPGTVVSHQHNGGWRPDQPRKHYAEEWLRAHGFAIRDTRDGREIADAPRAAWLMYSSG